MLLNWDTNWGSRLVWDGIKMEIDIKVILGHIICPAKVNSHVIPECEHCPSEENVSKFCDAFHKPNMSKELFLGVSFHTEFQHRYLCWMMDDTRQDDMKCTSTTILIVRYVHVPKVDYFKPTFFLQSPYLTLPDQVVLRPMWVCLFFAKGTCNWSYLTWALGVLG